MVGSQLKDDLVPTFDKLTDTVAKFPRAKKRNRLIRHVINWYTIARPIVWRFFNDRTSSIAASVC
jgi:hypothetical protein